MLDAASHDIRLHKLHGSVDWSHKPGWPQAIVDPRGLIRKPDGTLVRRSLLPELSLVFPSQNKIITESFLLDLHTRFRSALRHIDLLIIVGCSLGDAHVAGPILEGLAESRSLRALVVDPSVRAVARLLVHKGPPIVERIDLLPLGFADALNGPLIRAIRDALEGHVSLQRHLYDALRRPSIEKLLRLADLVAKHASLQPGDVRAFDAVLTAFAPPNASGALIDFVQQLRRSLAAGSAEELARALRASSRLGNRAMAVAAGIANADGITYFIGASGRLCAVDERDQETVIGRGVRDPFGLAVSGAFAYVVDRKALPKYPVEGIGAIRRIVLRNGQQKVLLKRATPLFTWSDLRQVAREARSVLNGSAPRRLLAEIASRVGLLNYPTAIRSLGPTRIVVVESRQAMVLDTDSLTPVSATLPDFLNLSDCAVIDDRRILLLEGGAFGEGRILLWDVAGSAVEVFLDGVSGGQGLAVHPSLSYLLLSHGGVVPDGTVERRDLRASPSLEPAKTSTLVLTGLNRPKYFAHVHGDDWVLSSDMGVISFGCR